MKLPNSLKRKLRDIKIIVMDVDGVMTHNEIIILDSGEEVKIWNVKDRCALNFIRLADKEIKLVWVTGRDSLSVRRAAKELNIDGLYTHAVDKKSAVEDISKKYKVRLSEILYVGDDLLDIPAMRIVGVACCPKDAVKEVKRICDYITESRGGEGVVREIVEVVLRCKNLWSKILNLYGG
jgi:3-deoxy-D-manno-octulosonate 8-phosphate phosphatase (KDO 8-P phosphatase)